MNEKRLLLSIEEMARKCNKTVGEGVTRFSWSKEDMLALSRLEKEFSRMGISTWTDGIGNLHALYKGKTSSPRVMIGSHLDTVMHGGKYDGTLGVLIALEVIRSFREEQFIPNKTIEFVAFAEEEGSNFGNICLGSKVLAGLIKPEMLKTLSNGTTTAWKMLKDFGLEPENLEKQIINPDEVSAFLEIHIEQGTELEKKQCSLGIVQAISGMRFQKVTYRGRSAHVASPMKGRLDPVTSFVECYQTILTAIQTGKLPEELSFTCGQIQCYPGINNVIPNECIFGIDLRHYEAHKLEQSWHLIEKIIYDIAKKNGIEVEIDVISATGGVKMSEKVIHAFSESAKKLGFAYCDIYSCPAHDTASMANIVPSGLLFVPSKNGLSHSPEEYTEAEDIIKGAKVFKEAVRMLAI